MKIGVENLVSSLETNRKIHMESLVREQLPASSLPDCAGISP
jgi:hypothetical protein